MLCYVYINFSGVADHVFVNFVDHGAFGLVAMPYDEVSTYFNNLDTLKFFTIFHSCVLNNLR